MSYGQPHLPHEFQAARGKQLTSNSVLRVHSHTFVSTQTHTCNTHTCSYEHMHTCTYDSKVLSCHCSRQEGKPSNVISALKLRIPASDSYPKPSGIPIEASLFIEWTVCFPLSGSSFILWKGLPSSVPWADKFIEWTVNLISLAQGFRGSHGDNSWSCVQLHWLQLIPSLVHLCRTVGAIKPSPFISREQLYRRNELLVPREGVGERVLLSRLQLRHLILIKRLFRLLSSSDLPNILYF